MCCGNYSQKSVPPPKSNAQAVTSEGVANNQRSLAAAKQKQNQQQNAQTKFINKKVISNPLIR